MAGKVGIVLGSNTHWAPYYYRYERLLSEAGIEFDLIYWDREGLNEKRKGNMITYQLADISDNKNPLKIIKFIAFSWFVQNVIKKNQYSKLIFLGTHGCAPIFCSTYLSKHYAGRYWLDIRDYQYEWFAPFRWMEKKAIQNSFMTSISSAGYRKFLPPYQYVHMHNIDPNMDRLTNEYRSEIDSNVIRISFIGNVRYVSECVKVVNVFANDSRFRVQFFGAGAEKIKAYCESKRISNVRFSGRFPPEQTLSFYNETDIVNNVYGNESIGLTTALSNKLYYALALKLPLLVSSETYMEEYVKEYNIGFVFENEPGFPDKLYRHYVETKKDKAAGGFAAAWNKVKEEDQTAVNILYNFLHR